MFCIDKLLSYELQRCVILEETFWILLKCQDTLPEQYDVTKDQQLFETVPEYKIF
jgi:hypothetical protein